MTGIRATTVMTNLKYSLSESVLPIRTFALARCKLLQEQVGKVLYRSVSRLDLSFLKVDDLLDTSCYML